MTSEQLILSELRALRSDLTTFTAAVNATLASHGASLASHEARLSAAEKDIEVASAERSTFRDKLYQYGLMAAWVAYVLFDQKPWEVR